MLLLLSLLLLLSSSSSLLLLLLLLLLSLLLLCAGQKSGSKACYAAYTFRLKHRWTYFLRTLPDIRDLLEPLENAISQVLIPAITEHRCERLDRDVLALPVLLGGLGLGNPSRESSREYASSVKVTTSLVEHIVS